MNKYNFSLLHFSIIKKENKHKANLVCVMYISFYLRMLNTFARIHSSSGISTFSIFDGAPRVTCCKIEDKINMFYSCTEKNPFLNVLYKFPLEYQIFVNQFHALFSIYVFKQCGMHSLEMNSENLRG